MGRRVFYSFLTIVAFLCDYPSVNGDENLLKLHLPGFITPLRYDLTIKTDPNDEIIDHKGEVRITIQCTQETKEIVVNRKYLEIEETDVKVIKLQAKDEEVGETVGVGGHDYNLELERYIIKVEKSLEKDKFYLITIPFVKKVDMNLPFHGYIKRTYESQIRPGYFKPLVYTKMGPIDARTIFPSLDQINVKTPFRIKLEHPKAMKAFSNANIDHYESVSDKPDWIRDVFEDTVPMTTYSVTMELLKFVSKKTTEPLSKVEIRVWSDETMIELIDYVFPVAFHSLKFYFEIFKVPYGFQKVDVVILSDKGMKVGESYGLIILSQEFVMKTIEQSRTEYEMVASLSRTISQQWIGYKVTMVWWDQNWLHRALNRFLQTVCINQIFPEWEFSYSAWDIVDAFVEVQRNEKKGIYNPILTLNEFPTGSFISENAETHEKIHQLIRMTYFFLGSKVFRERIKTYVDKYEFSHSNLPQILAAFGRTAIIKRDDDTLESYSVEEILKSWLNQKGLPIVNVKQDHYTKFIILTQERFVSLQLVEEETNVEPLSWIIPFSYTTQTELNFEMTEIHGWLTPKEPLVMRINGMERNQWIVLNSKLNVLGHVNYSLDNWELIKSYLLDSTKYFKFDVLTRVRFIHDIMALAEARKLSYTFAFTTLRYLRHEEHPLPLRVALDEFDILHSRLLRSRKARRLFKTHLQNILTHFYEREFITLDQVKFLESDYEDYRRKILIVKASCKYGVTRCADQSRDLEDSWSVEELPEKPRELRKIVLCDAVKNGDPSITPMLYSSYFVNNPKDFATDIIEALCCSTNKNVLQNLLKATLEDHRMDRDDRFRVFKSLSTNPKAYELLKTFFMRNYAVIKNYYSNDRIVTETSHLKVLIEMTKTRDEIQELTDFATSMELNWKTQEIEETIVNAKKRILWLSSFEYYTETHNQVLKYRF